ncbi:MAG: hypothetical protein AAF829_06665 [Pseudomonadota bacterium]
MKTWGVILIAIVASVVTVMGAIAAMRYQGWQGNFILDETTVQPGSDLSDNRRDWLLENDLLTPDETVLEFYADGVILFETGGVLLTDQYVGFWDKQDGELSSHWFRLGELCSIETVQEGHYFLDETYLLTRAGPDDWMRFSLSVEEGGHDRFMAQLRRLNEDAQTEMQREACRRNIRFDGASGLYPLPVSGDEIAAEDLALLKSREWRSEEETILALVSYAREDLKDTGTILTDQVFGTWWTENEEIRVFWFPFDQVCALVALESDEAEGFLWYETRSSKAWASFSLPVWDGEGEAMMDALRAEIAEAGGDISKPCPRFDQKPKAASGKPR